MTFPPTDLPQYNTQSDAATGKQTDPQALVGDGSVIALLKALRTHLAAIAVLAGAGVAFVFTGAGELETAPAKATAAAPVYGEGTHVPLSTDLAGNLRTSGGGGGGNPAGGWLDSVRRVGRMDSVTLIRTIDSLRKVQSVISIDSLRKLLAVDSVRTIKGIDSLRKQVSVDSIRLVRFSRDSIVTWLGSAAPTVGQKTMANSIPVVLPSDQTVNTTVVNPTDVNVPATAASGVIVRIAGENAAGMYSFTIPDVAGVAAANNFVCLFNVAASTDTLVLYSVSVNMYSNVAAATNNSILLTRVTSCTVGTLQAAAAINKYTTSAANATAEVRTGNPTVTAGAEVYAWGPNHVITAAGTTSADERDWRPIDLQVKGSRFYLRASEGVVVRQTAAGDTDQRLSITITWAERN